MKCTWWFALTFCGLAVANTSVNAAEKMVTMWSDDFIGPAGHKPYQNNWHYEIAMPDSENEIPGWDNNQLQCYSDSEENAAMDGSGNLVITALECSKMSSDPRCFNNGCNFTSARIVSSCTVKHGRVEVRMKIPSDQGLWSAIWMLGSDVESIGWPKCGSIGVALIKVNGSVAVVRSGLHGPRYANGIFNPEYTHSWDNVTYHVYAIDWDKDSITWSVDGAAYAKQNRADFPFRWVFESRFNVIVELAVSRDFADDSDDQTLLPKSLVIDYVRFQEVSGGNLAQLPLVIVGIICICVSTMAMKMF